MELIAKVGDRVEYYPFASTMVRSARVDSVDPPTTGRQAWQGHIISGPKKGLEVWGYMEQLTAVNP